jgi:hypothetical protein
MDTSPLRMEIDLSDHDLNGMGIAMPPRLTLCIALSKDLMCPPSGLGDRVQESNLRPFGYSLRWNVTRMFQICRTHPLGPDVSHPCSYRLHPVITPSRLCSQSRRYCFAQSWGEPFTRPHAQEGYQPRRRLGWKVVELWCSTVQEVRGTLTRCPLGSRTHPCFPWTLSTSTTASSHWTVSTVRYCC